MLDGVVGVPGFPAETGFPESIGDALVVPDKGGPRPSEDGELVVDGAAPDRGRLPILVAKTFVPTVRVNEAGAARAVDA